MDKIEKYEKTLVEQNVLNEKLIKIKANWKKTKWSKKIEKKIRPRI